ncbi:carbohydrate ABC transporter permease [Natronosalvus vescus]|uniref:carbohydrate ABC transporter permease n=1 Tax=Natronosalvus vescus TaxID=2953881 RepID=UPI002091D167|nr:sugar ABC transporter permease [Natronosalvus vescus]
MSLSSAGERSRERYQEVVPTNVQAWIDRNGAALLVLPGLLLFSTFMFFPLLYTVYLSLTDATPMNVFAGDGLRGEEQFVYTDILGLQLPLGNYVEVLADPVFWNSIGVTWLFVGFSVLLKVAFGIALAMVLTSDRIRGKRYLRSIVIIPWALPPIFTITIWSGVFSSARFGLANQFLIWLGFEHQAFFQDRWLAFTTYLITEMWLAYPFMVIITVSALQAVPDELIDAAKVDGAGFFHRFLNVTAPAIKRPVMFASILTAAASFQQFLIPYVFNRGGPGRDNELIILYGYREAFSFNEYGAGAAIMLTAVVFIAIFMLIAVWKGNLAEGVNN